MTWSLGQGEKVPSFFLYSRPFPSPFFSYLFLPWSLLLQSFGGWGIDLKPDKKGQILILGTKESGSSLTPSSHPLTLTLGFRFTFVFVCIPLK